MFPARGKDAMSTAIPRENPLAGLRALTKVMDEAVSIPGTRFKFGLDGIIGLAPVVGDLAGAAISGYGVIAALRMGAPASVIANMLLNLVIDAGIGAVPVVGDLFDFGWKANRRNLDLLERFARDPQNTRARSRRTLAAVMIALVL